MKCDVESAINMENAVNLSVDDGRTIFVKINDQSEYNEVQSTVLAEGDDIMAVVSRWTVAPIVDIKEC